MKQNKAKQPAVERNIFLVQVHCHYYHADCFLFLTWWLRSKTLKCDIKAYVQYLYRSVDVAPTVTNLYKVTLSYVSHALKKIE